MRTTHRILVNDEYIGAAQRLSISQNKTLRLIYQTWWVVWPPRVVLFACVVASLFVEVLRPTAALCGALLALSFGGELFKRRGLAKARERVRAKGSTNIVTMDDQGIETSSAFGTSHLNWKIMLEPVVYPDGVLIKLSRINMIWLPDTALVEGSPVDVRQLLAANVKG
jgi:hypothetical protein